MGIRLPLTAVLSFSSGLIATGPASTAGGIGRTFTIPQDADNIVIKYTASVMGGGSSATLQTTDDGGTTWWDVARTSIVSNANATVTAEWLSVPVIGTGVKSGIVAPSVVATGSVQSFGSVYGASGQAGASTLGQLAVSGLPIMSPLGRVFSRYTAAVTSILGETVTVYVNSQSGGTT